VSLLRRFCAVIVAMQAHTTLCTHYTMHAHTVQCTYCAKHAQMLLLAVAHTSSSTALRLTCRSCACATSDLTTSSASVTCRPCRSTVSWPLLLPAYMQRVHQYHECCSMQRLDWCDSCSSVSATSACALRSLSSIDYSA
jgi:hypothetical protein